jgi:TrmH family RNA methyltransferase
MITSRSNPLVRLAREARDGRAEELLFIEGVRLCEEASASALKIEAALYAEKLEADERGAPLLSELRRRAPRIEAVSADVMQSIADTKTPQGIVLLARRPASNRESFTAALHCVAAPLIVVLHQINTPSNAGAILRAAEAAGASGVIATKGATDLFAPKTLRGAMGSAFRLPVWTDADFAEAIDWCKERRITIYAADLRAPKNHTEIDWRRACAVVFGSEAHGLSNAETAAAQERIRIPMRAPVESLNVAVAASVILYEAARQRAFRAAQDAEKLSN